MHVGVVVPGSLTRRTGGYLYDRLLIRHLRSAGDQVSVFEIPHRRYPAALAANGGRDLERRIAAAGVDVLVEDALAHPALLGPNRRLRRRGGPPLVALVHLLRGSLERPAWRRSVIREVERSYLAGVDAWITVNDAIRRRIVGMRRVTEDAERGRPRFLVAPPAGDHVRAAALSPQAVVARAHAPGPLRILFVGALTPLKRPHLVVEAVARLPRESAHLTLVGGSVAAPGYVRRLHRRVAAWGAGDRVRFLGERDPAEVAKLLAASHVLAVPSCPESWSVAYLEAFTHGLPVVAHRESDAAALVEPSRTGLLVGDGEVEELAEGLGGLARERDRLAEMARAAWEGALARPTWEESMGAVRGFLAEVSGSR